MHRRGGYIVHTSKDRHISDWCEKRKEIGEREKIEQQRRIKYDSLSEREAWHEFSLTNKKYNS